LKKLILLGFLAGALSFGENCGNGKGDGQGEGCEPHVSVTPEPGKYAVVILGGAVLALGAAARRTSKR
jgi:hypothetical protein